jgi:tripartite-type tricarboxylate transporter receptor subunit TctC
MYLGPVATLASLIEAGKLRVLATAGSKRLAAYPNVPTLVELGYAGVELTDWLGVVAPQATPVPVVRKLALVIGDAVHDASIQQRLGMMGLTPADMDRAAFVAFFREEYLRWNRLVREAGIKAG